MLNLFRQEVVDAKRTNWLGPIRLASPVSHKIWTIAATFIAAGIVAWLLLGQYTRRERVTGTIVPQGGILDITARSSGVVERLMVSEGDQIVVDQVVALVSGERTSDIVGETGAEISSNLTEQRFSLMADEDDVEKTSTRLGESLRKQIEISQEQLISVDDQIQIQRKKIISLSDMLSKVEPLVEDGYIAGIQIQQMQTQVDDARMQEKILIKQRLDLQRQTNDAEYELDQLAANKRAKANLLARQVSQIDQSIAQNEADRSQSIRTNTAGTVSSILTKEGQSVLPGKKLVTIIPAGSLLKAQLLVPSKAVGFLRVGTRVVIRYQAFPYQKFGLQHGEIESISSSALMPNEVMEIAGKPEAPEPLYRIFVRLNKQSVTAYGREHMLRPGMQLEADLHLEKRTLFEWLFEPMYGMKKRVSNAD